MSLVLAAGAAPSPLTSFRSVVLGLTQGISEFLPISSSGHLVLVPWLFGWEDLLADKDFNKTFDVALHLGTFVGAAAYLRKDLGRLILGVLTSVRERAIRTPEQRLGWLLGLSAIPAAVVGALFEDAINERLGQPYQIAILLAVFGVILYVVDRRSARDTSFHEISGRQVAGMAVAQALALAPGVSRSGVTITAGRALGIDRDAVARYSFLMSLPVILGAGILSGAKLLGEPGGLQGQGLQFALGAATSAVSGATAVWGVLAIVRRRSYGGFAAYRVLAAATVLLLIAVGVRSATI